MNEADMDYEFFPIAVPKPQALVKQSKNEKKKAELLVTYWKSFPKPTKEEKFQLKLAKLKVRQAKKLAELKLKTRKEKKKATKLKNKMKTQKYWIEKMDKIAGDRCRAIGKCQNPYCKGENKVLQWAHIVSRSYHATRWDHDNCLCLCAACHKFYTDRPLEWENLVKRLYVIGILNTPLDELKKRALAKPKMNLVEYQEKYQVLSGLDK